MDSETNKDAKLLQKTPEEVNITEYKAAFYQLLAKTDSITKVFNRDAIIEMDDIYDLNDRVCKKFEHYGEAGFLIQTNIKFSDGKTKVFPNWDSLSRHTWHESESINNIVITWEFNAIFPGMQVPERHALMVKLSNGLRPEEMINLVFTGKIEEIEEMDNNLFPVVARVDFVDRVLGDELLNIVEDWVKSLQDSPVQKSKTMLFLKKNKGKVCSLINWVTNIIIMISSVWITGRYVLDLGFNNLLEVSSIQLVYIIYAIFLCVAVWIFSKKIIGDLTDFLFNRLRIYGENALFNITKGDRNKQDRLRRKEKSSRVVIFANIVFTIAINILCGIIVNIIS